MNPPIDYKIKITSGYRNPKRNDRVGGKELSLHQWGDAVDLAPITWPTNSNRKKALEVLAAAANELFKPDEYDVVLNEEKGYVHVEYDPN